MFCELCGSRSDRPNDHECPGPTKQHNHKPATEADRKEITDWILNTFGKERKRPMADVKTIDEKLRERAKRKLTEEIGEALLLIDRLIGSFNSNMDVSSISDVAFKMTYRNMRNAIYTRIKSALTYDRCQREVDEFMEDVQRLSADVEEIKQDLDI